MKKLYLTRFFFLSAQVRPNAYVILNAPTVNKCPNTSLPPTNQRPETSYRGMGGRKRGVYPTQVLIHQRMNANCFLLPYDLFS
jgi:hypothetical protein